MGGILPQRVSRANCTSSLAHGRTSTQGIAQVLFAHLSVLITFAHRIQTGRSPRSLIASHSPFVRSRDFGHVLLPLPKSLVMTRPPDLSGGEGHPYLSSLARAPHTYSTPLFLRRRWKDMLQTDAPCQICLSRSSAGAVLVHK